MTLEELLKIADQGFDSLIPFWNEEKGEPGEDDQDNLALYVIRMLIGVSVPSASREDQLNNAIGYMEEAESDIRAVIVALKVAMQN